MRKQQEPDYLRLQRELQVGKIRPVYLFYPEEDYLAEQAAAELVKKFFPHAEAKAASAVVDGREHALTEVVAMTDTVSLFGGSRLLLVKNAPYFAKGQRLTKELLQRLLVKNHEACLVFFAPEISFTAKVVKELNARGAVFRFEPLKGYALQNWVKQQLAAQGKNISGENLTFFVERIGGDLRNAANEIAKLAAFLGEKKEVTKENIMAVCTRTIQADIFALVDAVVYGRTKEALFFLRDLLAAGEPALLILAMLIRQFRLLGEAKELLAAGENDLAGALKIHPYAAKKVSAQAAKTSMSYLKRAVELLAQCELDIKRGRIEPVLALETLIVALGAK